MQIMEKKNQICLLFVAFLLLKGTCMYATVYNGTCGEHLTWTLNSEDSTLVINGRGDMSGIRFASESFRDVIKYVVFPEGLTSISECAFGETWNTCKNLQSVNLPDSVVSIGKKAFLRCSGIRDVRCGKGLKNIGDSAFFSCESMKHLELNDSLESIGIAAFYLDTALQGVIVFPENLKYLGSNAFGVLSQQARNLTAIWKARHCQHLRYSAGAWGPPLDNFSKIVFGEHVECVPDYLCYSTYCDTFILPESVDSIGEYAFSFDKNLKHIEMPSSISYIGERAFSYCDHLTSLRIPEGISVIPKGFATECHALSELTLPSTLDSIMGSTFNYCTSLTHITLPAGMRFIGDFAFSNCSNLEYMNLPEGLTSIGKSAFRTCTSLESVTIPESIKSIDEYTFADCSVLREVNMPNSIRQIAGGAFRNCSLDTLVLPSELTLIGTGAFLNQKKLTGIVIPDKVLQIKSNAFEGCTNLQKLQLGKKTAMIDAEAFKNDSLITEIRSRAAYPPLVESSTFSGVPDSAWLFVPVQSIAAYREDPVWGRFRMPKEEEINYVTVDAEETTATFTWPTDSTASSYQIDIYKDGEVFCKLTLGKTGQLLGITFSAPRRKAYANQADNSLSYTLSFMVTGLDAASRYNYVLSTLDENGTPLHVYIGDFATTGYTGELHGGGDEVVPTPPIIPSNPEAHQALENVDESGTFDGSDGKTFLNGQLLILRGEHVYDAQGKMVK